MIIMRLWGKPDGRATAYDGQWLKAFDFEYADGRGLLDTTPNKNEAMRFNDMAEAMEFYRRSPKCRPLRPDGQPNRPLTATNWSFESAA